MSETRTQANAITINGIRLDPATAEYVAGHPGGDYDFDSEQLRPFDEHLYTTPEGSWFIGRPLAPDEAKVWLEAHNDEVLLRRTIPADASAE